MSHIATIRFDRQQLSNRDRAYRYFSLFFSFFLVFFSFAAIRAADLKISSKNDLLKRQPALPLAPRPEMVDVRHFKISYDKKYYCGHPRQTVFKNFGNGEIVIGHNRGTTTRGGDIYEVSKDVSHGYWDGYMSRAVVLLQRSTDGASTWPEENNVALWDYRVPQEEQKAFLFQENAPREQYDMFAPDSLFFFGRAHLAIKEAKSEIRRRTVVCFALRSVDKGRTWEKVPTIIKHPFSKEATIHRDCSPVVRMPDGKTLLAVFTLNNVRRGPAIFSSTDQGLTWNYLSQPVYDARENMPGAARFTYANLLQRPNGDIHCYYLHIEIVDAPWKKQPTQGLRNAICLSVSKDGGKTWGDPVPIVGKGRGCWQTAQKHSYRYDYRSPWPIQLADGRIVVLFTRRSGPRGIGGVVSSDGGQTWSHEFVIREDAPIQDLGYQIGCQLEDGSIFVSYYYNVSDGNKFGGTRFIAGSTFHLK
jgi:hypothetical protein